jgi:hypothetical protein
MPLIASISFILRLNYRTLHVWSIQRRKIMDRNVHCPVVPSRCHADFGWSRLLQHRTKHEVTTPRILLAKSKFGPQLNASFTHTFIYFDSGNMNQFCSGWRMVWYEFSACLEFLPNFILNCMERPVRYACGICRLSPMAKRGCSI